MRGRADVGRGESAGDETCPCRGGERGERDSAGDETCPMQGRASVGRRSLLAMRPVHAGAVNDN